ncbi:MAG: hypothetical protein WC489_05210 [Patescibacteria group bacterium]
MAGRSYPSSCTEDPTACPLLIITSFHQISYALFGTVITPDLRAGGYDLGECKEGPPRQICPFLLNLLGQEINSDMLPTYSRK